ncbi:MAG TPA: aminoacyl-tRNA hydrolase [Gemmatimonadaceae bacterium]|nr:aminoacyl-tRNA hydrolase [Gemmatimonadaceae bacterium]
MDSIHQSTNYMKLVVGLGNPGRQYAGTRHNVGFDVVNEVAERHHAEWESAPRDCDALVAHWRMPSGRLTLAKPLTFMNLGGPAVLRLLQFFKLDLPDLLVVVDEANLELGRLRARAAGSAGGHNGLKSIIESLGTNEFARLRIGVGRGDGRHDLADHVLAKFESSERSAVADAVTRSADAVEMFVAEGIQPVMNTFNRREDAKENGKEDGKEDTE